MARSCAAGTVRSFRLCFLRGFCAARPLRGKPGLLGGFRVELLLRPRLDRVIADLPLRLESAQAGVHGEPARLGAQLHDDGRGGALDQADRVVLAGEDADGKVRFQVGVDPDVALPALPDRLRHGGFSTTGQREGTARTVPGGRAPVFLATVPACDWIQTTPRRPRIIIATTIQRSCLLSRFLSTAMPWIHGSWPAGTQRSPRSTRSSL